MYEVLVARWVICKLQIATQARRSGEHDNNWKHHGKMSRLWGGRRREESLVELSGW